MIYIFLWRFGWVNTYLTYSTAIYHYVVAFMDPTLQVIYIASLI